MKISVAIDLPVWWRPRLMRRRTPDGIRGFLVGWLVVAVALEWGACADL